MWRGSGEYMRKHTREHKMCWAGMYVKREVGMSMDWAGGELGMSAGGEEGRSIVWAEGEEKYSRMVGREEARMAQIGEMCRQCVRAEDPASTRVTQT